MIKINKFIKLNKRSILGLLFAFVLFFNIQSASAYTIYLGNAYNRGDATVIISLTKYYHYVGEKAVARIDARFASNNSKLYYLTLSPHTAINNIDGSNIGRLVSNPYPSATYIPISSPVTTNALTRSGQHSISFFFGYAAAGYDTGPDMVLDAYYNVRDLEPTPTPTPVLPPIVNIRFE